jgi:hypothetical protein
MCLDVENPAGCLPKDLGFGDRQQTTIYYCVTNLTTEIKHKCLSVTMQCLETLPLA